MRGLEKLFPPVASAATWFKQLAANNGWKIQITDTLRTNAEQKALYANSRESLDTINQMRKAAALVVKGWPCERFNFGPIGWTYRVAR